MVPAVKGSEVGKGARGGWGADPSDEERGGRAAEEKASRELQGRGKAGLAVMPFGSCERCSEEFNGRPYDGLCLRCWWTLHGHKPLLTQRLYWWLAERITIPRWGFYLALLSMGVALGQIARGIA